MDDNTEENLAKPMEKPKGVSLEVTLVTFRHNAWFNVGTIRVLTDTGELLGDATNLDDSRTMIAPHVLYNGVKALDVTYWGEANQKLARNRTYDLTEATRRQNLPVRQPFSSADDTVSRAAPMDDSPKDSETIAKQSEPSAEDPQV
jgi:hypothetical protein